MRTTKWLLLLFGRKATPPDGGEGRPQLLLSSVAFGNKPQFAFDIPDTDLEVGDVIRLQIRNDSDLDWATPVVDIQHAITEQEEIDQLLALDIPYLSNGSFDARAMKDDGPWSNTLNFEVAVTAIPNNLVAPHIDGVALAGQTITSTPGVWEGTYPQTISYQWQSNGEDIDGATDSNYVVDSGHAGTTITLEVTSTNDVGNTSVITNSVSGAFRQYLNSNNYTSGDELRHSATFEMADGPADGFLVIIAATNQFAQDNAPVVTANGVTIDIPEGAFENRNNCTLFAVGEIDSADGAINVNIEYTQAIGFANRNMAVWIAKGLQNFDVKNVTGAYVSNRRNIAVDANDFLFAIAQVSNATYTFNPTPDRTSYIDFGCRTGDWQIAEGDAEFLLQIGENLSFDLMAVSVR